MKQLTISAILGAWAPDQLYAALLALPGFAGLNTAEFSNPETGQLEGEIRLHFADGAALPTEQDILALLASVPPPPPPKPPTPEERISKLETDVANLKARPAK